MNMIKMLLPGILTVCFSSGINCTKEPVGPGPNKSPNAEAVALDKSDLKITYEPGDSAGSVTENIGLPTSGSSGSSISWVTSNYRRISVVCTSIWLPSSGAVIRPPYGGNDTMVTLTATISKGIDSDVKVFVLKVKAIGSVAIPTGTVIDCDSNVYTTVRIGHMEWMAENLRVTRYNDGSEIPWVADSAAWKACSSSSAPAYCYFNNTTNTDSIKKFGALYNWYVISPANPKKIAPPGWHVPTVAEWKALEDYLIGAGYNWDGTYSVNKIAKSLAAKTGWRTSPTFTVGAIGYDLTLNNGSGFSALAVDYRSSRGNFGGMGYHSHWWSATESEYYASEAKGFALDAGNEHSRETVLYKSMGNSIRLLRDN